MSASWSSAPIVSRAECMARMRHANVHRTHRHERRGNGSERRAATTVAAVDKELTGNVVRCAEFLYDGHCFSITGVRLARRLLDGKTTAEDRTHDRIAFFGVIWMHGMNNINR